MPKNTIKLVNAVRIMLQAIVLSDLVIHLTHKVKCCFLDGSPNDAALSSFE